MSEILYERRREILDSLQSTVCSGCGGVKKARMSHCGRCYHKLPQWLKRKLYSRFGEGYEEAYEDSLKILKGENK